MKIVIFTGAGISAESGLRTFRDSDGLWENHRIEDVATPEAWRNNPQLVLDFYNQRRKDVLAAEPNAAHKAIARLESRYEVQIITQNIDNLHERAGSTNVLHLHGLISQARSSKHEHLLYDIDGWEMKLGETCEKGSQLRPNIVWFGEEVPMYPIACELAQTADIFIVIGTSLQVNPAAMVVMYAPSHSKKILIDPKAHEIKGLGQQWQMVHETACIGVPSVVEDLLN